MTEPQPANLPVKASTPRIRLRAIAMQLVADQGGRYVEMHIVTDRGQTLVVACENESLMAMRREIQGINRDGPEISAWA